MSESTPGEEEALWVWQGFFGPTAVATTAKVIVDEDLRAGARIPLYGEPPRQVDVDSVTSMFAVQVRPYDQIPCPEGLFEADPNIVGRLVGG